MADEILEKTEAPAQPAEQPAAVPEPEPRIEGDQPSPEEVTPTDGGAKEPSWYVKKIGKLTARLRESERQVESLRGTASQPIQREEFPKAKPVAPRMDQFDDLQKYGETFAAYNEELSDWKLSKREYEANLANQQRAFQDHLTKKAAVVRARIEEAEDKYEDFDDALTESGLRDDRYTVMVDAMLESDHFGDLSYWLAKHPNEIKRISGLSYYGQIREIARLEDKIKSQEALRTKQEKAEPTSVERGGAGIAPKSSDKVSAQREFEKAMKSGDFTDYIFKTKKLG